MIVMGRGDLEELMDSPETRIIFIVRSDGQLGLFLDEDNHVTLSDAARVLHRVAHSIYEFLEQQEEEAKKN